MKAKEIRSMTIDEIESKLIELRDKLFKQKIQKSIGQMANLYTIRSTKKDIAKLLTILTEKRSNNEKQGRKKEKN
jgi:large subunit ribosomal protein L29